ncbi:hypothetical protein LSH36_12g01043 [Paralvinella palmiformis]|uniref:Uncharacterized protein n=1 Tax=Paralvinella palmiformis TaxID=53620 RepID=A0AAD9NHR9_9ANNE|nr:hypothetical protein LSH36_12g01043 [Paralvinella palmiformis]
MFMEIGCLHITLGLCCAVCCGGIFFSYESLRFKLAAARTSW